MMTIIDKWQNTHVKQYNTPNIMLTPKQVIRYVNSNNKYALFGTIHASELVPFVVIHISAYHCKLIKPYSKCCYYSWSNVKPKNKRMDTNTVMNN